MSTQVLEAHRRLEGLLGALVPVAAHRLGRVGTRLPRAGRALHAAGRADGSVVVERTVGEVSARCHDEEANSLALNLMHDIVTGEKTAQEARKYYAKEFLDYRRGKPTPYMLDGLQFDPGDDTPDPDEAVLTDEDMERASEEGEKS